MAEPPAKPKRMKRRAYRFRSRDAIAWEACVTQRTCIYIRLREARSATDSSLWPHRLGSKMAEFFSRMIEVVSQMVGRWALTRSYSFGGKGRCLATARHGCDEGRSNVHQRASTPHYTAATSRGTDTDMAPTSSFSKSRHHSQKGNVRTLPSQRPANDDGPDAAPEYSSDLRVKLRLQLVCRLGDSGSIDG